MITRRSVLGFVLSPLVMPAADVAGFVSLFDGRTLRGWNIIDGPDSAFYVETGALVVSQHASPPTWLRSEREYENFDLRGEFFVKGWTDSGVFVHAPRYGRATWCGMQMKVFHAVDDPPRENSMGAILPVIAPNKVNVRQDWNDFRILMDWPSLRIWTNGELIQELNVETNPELRHRLRSGYLGFPTVLAGCRYRNLRIRELPGKEKWSVLYGGPEDMDKWFVSEGKPQFETHGEILRGDGAGHLATKEQYKDFELELYVRAARAHNGGVLFRSEGKGTRGQRNYEIQLHSVEEAHYPTGSLYHYKRAKYPHIADEKWYLIQLRVEGSNCMVRIDGETVLEYSELKNVDAGHIELQTHHVGYWTEFQRIRIRAL